MSVVLKICVLLFAFSWTVICEDVIEDRALPKSVKGERVVHQLTNMYYKLGEKEEIFRRYTMGRYILTELKRQRAVKLNRRFIKCLEGASSFTPPFGSYEDVRELERKARDLSLELDNLYEDGRRDELERFLRHFTRYSDFARRIFEKYRNSVCYTEGSFDDEVRRTIRRAIEIFETEY